MATVAVVAGRWRRAVVTRRLFLQDDATACKCDDCFVVWYRWTLEQLHRGDDFDLYWDETLYCQ